MSNAGHYANEQTGLGLPFPRGDHDDNCGTTRREPGSRDGSDPVIAPAARTSSSPVQGDPEKITHTNPLSTAPPDSLISSVVSAPDDDGPPGIGGGETPEFYPEGGLEAWLVVFGAWLALFSSLGLLNSVASFQSYVSRHQLSELSQSKIGWIFSLNSFMCFFTGVYIGPLFDKYGPRWLVLGGTVLLTGSLVALSFCREYWQFMLSYGLLNGLGMSLLFTPSLAAVGHFFKRRRGLAMGIASAGGGIGGMVIPAMLDSLLDRLGWAWSVRILALLSLVTSGLSNFFLRSRLPPAPNASAHPDARIFKDPAFALTTAGIFLIEFALFIPLTYISLYAISRGLSSSLASRAVTILNAGSVIGRILPGYYADKFGTFNACLVITAMAILSCLGLWLPTSLANGAATSPAQGGDHKSAAVAPVVLFALLFGFTSGSNIGLSPVVVGTLCATESYGRYYSTCYTVVSIGALIGVPVAGSILASTGGDYWGLILFTAMLYVGAFIALYATKVTKVGWKPTARF